jgi:hypothetical protein
MARAEQYQSFLSTWKTLLAENAWENLKGIIGAPINIEAALEHLAEEETFDADESDDLEEEPYEIAEEPSNATLLSQALLILQKQISQLL